MHEVGMGRTFIGRLDHGMDLLGEITRVCVEKEIRLGKIEALGAVERARLGYYDQAKRSYRFYDLKRPMEITNLTGNVSLRLKIPFVHAHVTLTDKGGRAFGGHLAPGTIIFACELVVQELTGASLNREEDPFTGLPLWSRENGNAPS